MNSKISDNVWNILICPNCGMALGKSAHLVICSYCGSQYKFDESDTLDLRLQIPKKYNFQFELGTSLNVQTDFDINALPVNLNPEVDYSYFDVPYRLNQESLSYFPKAQTDNSLMLDLGCGNTIHRKVCEYAGFEYVGVDYKSTKATILGDAHSLPFKDNSFEFILSVAVLEHIRFPFVMMKEAYRVLKPNGMIIGTVAFLEPFHEDSFYHHTHLGTYNSLQEGGFTILGIFPSKKWTVLVAQTNMLFPMMPRLLSESLIMPLQIMHKIWWRIGGIISVKALEKTRLTNTTGSFTYIAKK